MSAEFLAKVYPRNDNLVNRGNYIINVFSNKPEVLVVKNLLVLYSHYHNNKYTELYQHFQNNPKCLDAADTQLCTTAKTKLDQIVLHFFTEPYMKSVQRFQQHLDDDKDLGDMFKEITCDIMNELSHFEGFKYIATVKANQKVVDYLQERSDNYFQDRNYKFCAYDRAIDNIVAADFEITAENCTSIKGVASGLAGHIIECIGGNLNCSLENSLKKKLQKNLSDFLRSAGFTEMADEFDEDFKKSLYLPQKVADMTRYKKFTDTVKETIFAHDRHARNIFNIPLVRWLDTTYLKTGSAEYSEAAEKICGELRPVTLADLERIDIDPEVSERATGELAGVVDCKKYALMREELDHLRRQVKLRERCERFGQGDFQFGDDERPHKKRCRDRTPIPVERPPTDLTKVVVNDFVSTKPQFTTPDTSKVIVPQLPKPDTSKVTVPQLPKPDTSKVIVPQLPKPDTSKVIVPQLPKPDTSNIKIKPPYNVQHFQLLKELFPDSDPKMLKAKLLECNNDLIATVTAVLN